MHTAALVVDLPSDGEPEPDLHSDGDVRKAGADAIIGRNKEDSVVQMVEGFGVTQLSDEDLLEIISGLSDAADPSSEVGDGDGGARAVWYPSCQETQSAGSTLGNSPPKSAERASGMAVWPEIWEPE